MVYKNYEQAFLWYTKSASQGSFVAEDSRILMIFLGQGTPQDQQQALLLSEKAARNGSTDALLLLSHMFYKGEGASRNLIEALKWADIAVDLYSPEAQEVRDLIAEEISSSEINTANELANEWLDNELYRDVIEIDIHIIYLFVPSYLAR